LFFSVEKQGAGDGSFAHSEEQADAKFHGATVASALGKNLGPSAGEIIQKAV
jgi:hypothetical protein